jgi:CheY-like chemotaxis protein
LFGAVFFDIAQPTITTMRILVCEDNEVERKVIEMALAGEGAEVVYASDGRKALAQLNAGNEFDLIITDIHMPYHNGDEILNLVREQQKRSTPIVMISSDGQEEVIKLALKLGVNEFLEKPISPEKVKKKLKKFLR